LRTRTTYTESDAVACLADARAVGYRIGKGIYHAESDTGFA
jgi:hypothetical protein